MPDPADNTLADDLAAASRVALAGGDPSRLGTKLPVRRRIELLLDPGTWVEDGLLANSRTPGYPADGVLTGTGSVGGRRVVVLAHDPTVKAGSWGALNVEKHVRILERADRDLLPVFYFVDSAGGRLTDEMGFFPGRRGASRIFALQVALSGRVPQICCLFGPATAGGAYLPAFTDWVGMVEANGSMSLASPPIVERVTGERTTLAEMGGARMHATVSGCGDDLYDDDAALVAAAKRLFDYLPDSWRSRPTDRPRREARTSAWTGVVPDNPRQGYDVRAVLERLIDADSWFEVKPLWAQEIVVGFARLAGRSVGIVANQPKVRGGALHVDSADKAARFISLCDAFNVPLVFVCDVPGFMVGTAAERRGIIRHGAKMMVAMASAEVPKISVIVRKAHAAGFYAMCAPGFEPRVTLALPSAQIAVMGAEAAVSAVHGKRLEAIADAQERAAFLAARVAEHQSDLSVLRMASDLVVDAVVQPEELRAQIVARLAAADGWTRSAPSRHHPVSPV